MTSLPSIFDYLPGRAELFIKRALPESPDASTARPDDNQLPKHPALHALGTVGAGALGFGAGTLAGLGASQALSKMTGRTPPAWVRSGAPVVGGAAGLAYNLYKQYELEELKRALESHRNQPSGRNTGQ